MVDVSVIALLLATAVNMVVGSVWYGPLFGKSWQRLVGLSDKDMAKADKVTPMVAMVLLAFVQAFVLLHFVSYAKFFYPEYTDVAVGVLTGAWAWLGLVLPALGGAYMFAQRRKKLLIVDTGYSLVVLLINGVLLSIMQ